MKLLDSAGPSGLVARRGGIELSDRIGTWRAASFEVLAIGEARLILANDGAHGAGLRAGGGAVTAAMALARRGVRVGLAAAVADDAHGRALVAEVQGAGVDAGGVSLVAPRSSLLRADWGAQAVPFDADGEPAVVVPDTWRTELLLVSGLSPALEPAAALCKAARAARRAGALVVIDVNARPHAWSQRDPRLIHAILREADVVRCSTADVAALWIDRATVRASMRPSATLVVTDGPAAARALGPFGEIVVAPQPLRTRPSSAGDLFTAAICAALVRGGDPGAERADAWERILRCAHTAASGVAMDR